MIEMYSHSSVSLCTLCLCGNTFYHGCWDSAWSGMRLY